MSGVTKKPALSLHRPPGISEVVWDFLVNVKLILDQYEGSTGTDDDKILTKADLQKIGIDKRVLDAAANSFFFPYFLSSKPPIITDNAVIRGDGGYRGVQGSSVTIDDNGDITISGLTASRLASTDANKKLVSVANLASWIAGTANEITITNDGDGTITVSIPDNVTLVNPTVTGDLTFSTAGRINWTKITANGVTINGFTSSDTVADLQSNDGTVFHVDEATGAPGFWLVVEFTNVSAFNWVQIIGAYVGQSTHWANIELYNFSNAVWDRFNSMDDHPSISILEQYGFFVPDDADYIGTGGDVGKVRVGFNHTMTGNSSHDLELMVVALYQ